MIKLIKNILFALCILQATSSLGQSSSNSPYSQYGLGQLSEPLLPQSRSMGGIAAGLRRTGNYSNINLANPASYSSIQITTFDIGLYTGITSLSKGGTKENSFTGSLNHLTFGVPVSRWSALSFGIVPYSTVGYRSRIQSTLDTITIDHVHSGNGGISKAYAGYGFQIVPNLSLGANVSYLFGKLEENFDAEFPGDPEFINSRNSINRSVGGISIDYGLQYYTNLSKKVKLTVGYAGTAKSTINSSTTEITSRYTIDASGNDNIPLDSTYSKEGVSQKLKLPMTHRLGFVLEQTNKWVVGADVTMGQWSQFRDNNTDPGLKNTFGLALGAQITPDITSIGSYFKLVDYRFGFKYDKSYVNLKNTDIKQYALTLGLGLPLPSNRSTFYKINIGTELGQRGTTKNDLVRERFANIYLGFTINDRWFQRYKFD